MPFPNTSSCLYCVLVLIATISGGFSKIYERCELARELRKVHKIAEADVATWVCLARHESEFNTSAVNLVSGDHGLFQISQLFWCSPPGEGHACGLSCDQLKDEDIKDDVICAKRIFREHKRLSGDGFNAWVVYRIHCSDGRAKEYAEGCFTAASTTEPDTNNEVKWGSAEPEELTSVHPTSWKSSTSAALPTTSFETTSGSTSSPVKTSTVHPSANSLANSLAKRVNYPYGNNIVKHAKPLSSANYANENVYNARTTAKPAQSTSTTTYFNTIHTPLKPVSHIANIVKHAKPSSSVNYANENAYNVAIRTTAKPTQSTSSATSYTRQTSLKPVSNNAHKGFRIINGKVTYY